ncbi:MAG: ATP phosphoribosyltransferase [Melioribacteraceae bacterium]|nr:MAG: ATP phosphoribosyltransferase [Melioribacteraceae bacterium]
MNGNLKLAIQKKGRLSDKSLELLKSCGFDIENYSERLFISANNFKLDILFLRDDDIPEYVQDGVADIGIVGENVLIERGAKAEIIKKLGFGKCKLMIGVPEEEDISDLISLNEKRIATSHPQLLKKFLDENLLNSRVIDISGSVEIAPSLGVADYICDIVSTGNTLKSNKLKESFTVFESEAVIIKSKDFNPTKQNLLNEFKARIDSVLLAKNSKYLMMNVAKESLEKIQKIIPSLKSPTVVPLAEENLVAVHAVIPKEKFWSIVGELKSIGATGIILLPIENMIL